MIFRTIDIFKDRETIINFRKDAFIESFGSTEGFGDEEDYIQWATQFIDKNPEGMVIIEENSVPIGQIELRITKYKEKEIGYINLFYLIPGYRDRGMGKYLTNYAEKIFKKHKVKEYHLRVSKSNQRAIRFYMNNGMEILCEEFEIYPMWRMRKEFNSF